ncbi:MAG TPA: Mur ligase domain-containing protein [Buchnera sp. (in: enterobacteria)]|nr:Mur ligase domain-containing protein [Buchnera sp. (in: enterobacteria)]
MNKYQLKPLYHIILKINNIQHIYFFRIIGSGMNDTDEILVLKGYVFSGSDLTQNHITEKLINIEVKIYF